MSGYITTLIGTVIICSLAAMLVPEDKGMLGYVKLAAGLCVLCVAISPITSFISALMEFDVSGGGGFLGGISEGKNDFDEIYEESLLGAGEQSTSGGLKSILCREFELESDEIEVSVKLLEAGNEYLAESVTVIFVGGKAIFTNPHDVIDYVTELLGCSCEIIYG